MKIKKGDNIMIVTGKDKGKTGKVEKSLPKDGKVIVSGLNLRKYHQKPTRKDQKGQIVERSMPLDISNIMILDPKTEKPTRVGIKLDDKGNRSRIAKKSKSILN